MKSIIYLILLSGVFIGCADVANKASKELDYNKDFESFTSNFMEDWWKENPVWAMYNGYYKYDSVLNVPSHQNEQKSIAFYNQKLEALRSFPKDSLSTNNLVDYMILENQLNASIWYATTFKSNEWDASNYNVGGSMALIINGDYASKEQRFKSLKHRLSNVPAYYQEAINNLKNPVLEHVRLGIGQNKGALSVLNESLLDSLEGLNWQEAQIIEFKDRLLNARKAIENYIDHLNSLEEKLTDDPNRKSFRIGKEIFNQKFKYDIVSGYTADEIYEDAIKMKSELHAKMYDLSVELWSKYGEGKMPNDTLKVIDRVIQALSLEHVHRDSFINEIRNQIPTLVSFIKEKNLIYIDPSKPLVVRATPEYMRGVAGASITSPGPYEPEANTYYNVTPLDHYSEEEAESYLREYNKYILQILNIHEAIPGHYTQLVYSNQSPSLVKSIFGNGAMVEGWAVYTERMMLEEGYGENAPEMWLMYYKWNLRTVCNTILDYSVHCLDLSEEDAMDLLVNQAFQQNAEAKGKWKRAKLSQVQLCSYYTGYREIYNLRETYKSKVSVYSVKKFHESFLSFGSAPVKFIKPLLLEDVE